MNRILNSTPTQETLVLTKELVISYYKLVGMNCCQANSLQVNTMYPPPCSRSPPPPLPTAPPLLPHFTSYWSHFPGTDGLILLLISFFHLINSPPLLKFTSNSHSRLVVLNFLYIMFLVNLLSLYIVYINSVVGDHFLFWLLSEPVFINVTIAYVLLGHTWRVIYK